MPSLFKDLFSVTEQRDAYMSNSTSTSYPYDSTSQWVYSQQERRKRSPLSLRISRETRRVDAPGYEEAPTLEEVRRRDEKKEHSSHRNRRQHPPVSRSTDITISASRSRRDTSSPTTADASTSWSRQNGSSSTTLTGSTSWKHPSPPSSGTTTSSTPRSQPAPIAFILLPNAEEQVLSQQMALWTYHQVKRELESEIESEIKKKEKEERERLDEEFAKEVARREGEVVREREEVLAGDERLARRLAGLVGREVQGW